MRRSDVARTLTTAILAAAVAAGGCSRKKPHDQGFPSQADLQQAGGSGALPPPPSVGPGALAGQGGAMGMGGASGNMPQDDVHAGLAGGHPGGADVGQMGLPPPDPNRTIDPNKYLRGTITPTDATKAKHPGRRRHLRRGPPRRPKTGQPAGGMPMAVERLTASGWPVAFNLTEAQAMIGGTGFAGDVVVTARYDQDGDALSKQSGDITGEVKATIPADKLQLKLDTVLP